MVTPAGILNYYMANARIKPRYSEQLLARWGVDIQDEESIETVIFHKKDNAELGEVIYMPCASDISSISDIKGNKPVDNRIFNLQGQQLKQTQKGLNIIGGRIHVVK